jgi:hypothetical protein
MGIEGVTTLHHLERRMPVITGRLQRTLLALLRPAFHMPEQVEPRPREAAREPSTMVGCDYRQERSMRQLIRALVAALVATVLAVPVSTHQIHAAGRSGAAPSGVTLPAGLAPVLQQELTAGDGAFSDNFGWSVAVSGDTAVIGAPVKTVGANQLQGAAYVFVRSGSTWVQQTELTAADGAAFNFFGAAVAVSGDTIVAGTSKYYGAGAAYVFARSGGTWVQQAELTAGGGGGFDLFGQSVAVTGDTVVVGDPVTNVGANQYQGAAYVFARNGGTWSQQQELTASDGATGDSFGNAVAMSGDTIVVGAPYKTVGANLTQGAAYVFARGGAWTQQQELTAADGAFFDLLGYSVAISGDTIVVGAIGKDVGANHDQGAAYVFARSGNTWGQQAELTASNGASAHSFPFGSSVAVSGDIAVVGATETKVGANLYQGAAYEFTRSGGTWSQQQELTASDGANGDEFGWSVAVSGDTAVVGAYNKSFGANLGQGAAYTFKASSRG